MLESSYDDVISNVDDILPIEYKHWNTALAMSKKNTFGHIPFENFSQSMNLSVDPCR